MLAGSKKGMKREITAAIFICCLGVAAPYFVVAHNAPPYEGKTVAMSEKAETAQPVPVESSLHEQVSPEAVTVDGMEQYLVNIEEISDEAEKEYVKDIRAWLATLPEAKAKLARPILVAMHPELHELRKEIYNKRLELIALSYKKGTAPETLPMMGQQLQKLRMKLKAKLNEVNERLRKEALVEMGPLAAEGFWLQPIAK